MAQRSTRKRRRGSIANLTHPVHPSRASGTFHISHTTQQISPHDIGGSSSVLPPSFQSTPDPSMSTSMAYNEVRTTSQVPWTAAGHLYPQLGLSSGMPYSRGDRRVSQHEFSGSWDYHVPAADESAFVSHPSLISTNALQVPYRDHVAELGANDMTSDFGFAPTTGSESSGTLQYHATHPYYQTSEMMSSRLINPFSVYHYDPRPFTPPIPGSNSTSTFVGNLDSQRFESPVSHGTEMQSTSEFVWSDPYTPLGYSATHIPGAEDGSFAYPSTPMPHFDVPSPQYEETSIVTGAPDTSFDGLLASDSDKCNRVPTPGGASAGQSFES